MGPLEDATAYRFQRLGRYLRIHLGKVLQEHKPVLTQEQYFILYRLYREDGQNPGQLSDPVFLDHGNITRLSDQLLKKKLIRRERDDEDRRKNYLFIEPAGKAYMESLLPVIGEIRKELWGSFKKREMQTIEEALSLLEVKMFL